MYSVYDVMYSVYDVMYSVYDVMYSVYNVMYSVYDVMYNGGAQCFSYQTSSSPLPRVVNVKLADYGISRFANPGGVKGEEGTPGYLAPEAIRRRGEDQAFDEKVCTFNTLTCPTTTSFLSLSLCTHTHAFTHTHHQVDIFSFAMLLFELLTGQRPFENLTTIQEIYKVTLKGDRPLLQEGNLEPSFPSMINLMYDCWKQTAAERPSANEVRTTPPPRTLN